MTNSTATNVPKTTTALTVNSIIENVFTVISFSSCGCSRPPKDTSVSLMLCFLFMVFASVRKIRYFAKVNYLIKSGRMIFFVIGAKTVPMTAPFILINLQLSKTQRVSMYPFPLPLIYLIGLDTMM